MPKKFLRLEELKRLIRIDTADCIEWPHAHSDGYGQIATPAGVRRTHIVAWELANGRRLPKGKVIRHQCDNKPCINPIHLLLGTQTQNAHEANERGLCPSYSLTDDEVLDILVRCHQPVDVLAREFQVAESMVIGILSGRNRKSVPRPEGYVCPKRFERARGLRHGKPSDQPIIGRQCKSGKCERCATFGCQCSCHPKRDSGVRVVEREGRFWKIVPVRP